MNLQMRLRLSTMMFLEYFIWGAGTSRSGTWLGQGIHFSGEQIGLAFGTNALGAVLSPFFVGLMADELFANQKLLWPPSTPSVESSCGSPRHRPASVQCTSSF